MTDVLGDLARARLEWVPPPVRRWYDEERLLRQLASSLEAEAGRVGDEAFGASFRDDVGLAVETTPAQWANRRFELASGGWVVVGIRFRGLDVARPFVDVVATTAPPTAEGLAEIADAVLPSYELFAPLAVRIEPPDPAHVDGTVDQYLVAGRVEALRTWRRSPSYAAVTLRSGKPGAMAELAARVYAGLPQGRERWASAESEDSLQDCAEEGLLFEVIVEDTSAGVVAAVRDDRHGMSGFGVEELCLDATWRGRGLAAGAVQRLVDALPAEEGDVLWGTIHPDNAPSLRNALSVGRQIVGGYVWVTPAGMPGMPNN
ncbi:MAG: GNAT family N-acetyltransferase [Nocardioides sp.]